MMPGVDSDLQPMTPEPRPLVAIERLSGSVTHLWV
jgi:hypothetical protein